MCELLATRQFSDWLDRLRSGLLDDAKPLGSGVIELRIHLGAGYRVYYSQVGNTLLLLLAGGDKSTQSRDIRRATALLREWRI